MDRDDFSHENRSQGAKFYEDPTTCHYCGQTCTGTSCTYWTVLIQGIDYERIAVEYAHRHPKCDGCRAPSGGKHHPGCLHEMCPMEECGQTIMECGHGDQDYWYTCRRSL